MKLLVVDKFAPSTLERLRTLGFAVEAHADAKGDALVQLMKDHAPEVLVVRSTKAPDAVLAASPRLSLVVRAGSGVDNVDVGAASKRGIFVSNCPGKNAVAVAELALGLMLSLDRRIPDNVAELRAGKWNKKEYSQARGLHGRTLGLLGVGQIGQVMARYGRALGMRVVAWDKYLTAERAEALGVDMLGLAEDVAAFGDVISVHLPLLPATQKLCGPSFFAAMKHGAFFINTSRGELVDESALKLAMETRGVRAALDVFDGEPTAATGEFRSAISTLPTVYGTHHIGASTEQAQDAIADEMIRVVSEYRQTGRVPNVVNMTARSQATHVLTVRHHDRPGVLAHVLNGLKSAGVNVQEMENVVFEGSHAGLARIHINRGVDAETLKTLQDTNTDIMELKLLLLQR